MCAVFVGRYGKVVLGTYAVAEQSKWSIDGITLNMLDATDFQDAAKEYVAGLTDYGNVSFSGWFDMTDTTGQKLLDSANRNASKITNLKFYVDNTSFYQPDSAMTDAGIWITSMKISMDVAGIGTIDFTGKCTGPLVLY